MRPASLPSRRTMTPSPMRRGGSKAIEAAPPAAPLTVHFYSPQARSGKQRPLVEKPKEIEEEFEIVPIVGTAATRVQRVERAPEPPPPKAHATVVLHRPEDIQRRSDFHHVTQDMIAPVHESWWLDERSQHVPGTVPVRLPSCKASNRATGNLSHARPCSPLHPLRAVMYAYGIVSTRAWAGKGDGNTAAFAV